MALAACGVLAALGLVVTASPAAASPVPLPIAGYADMLVDEAHGHLFFTSGGSSVIVTNLSGGSAVALSGIGGAYGLAQSPDGSTVYVAAETGDAIDAINTTTLTVTTAVSRVGCPHSLAYAGHRLYFSYGCYTAGTAAIGSVDFTVSPPRVRTGYAPGWYSPPKLASGGPATDLLVAVQTDLSPATLVAYDVGGGSLSSPRTAQGSNCSNLGAVAVDSRGAHIAVACGAPYYVSVYDATTMTVDDTYGDSSPYPVAAAFSPDDAYLACGFTQENPNVVVYPFGTPTAPAASYSFEAGAQGDLPADGLRFGASGALYGVVPTDVYGDGWDLVVEPAPTTAPVSVSVSAPTSSPLDATLSVHGAVTSPTAAFTKPVTLRVRRIDLAGVHLLAPVQTDSSGQYSFTDAPHVGGTVQYEVDYNAAANGDTQRRNAFGLDAVDVPRIATSISAHFEQSSYDWADTATLVTHLGTTDNSRQVSVYARTYGLPQYRVATQDVDSGGNLVVGINVYERTTATAVFAGDYRYAPAQASVTVPVHAVLEETLYRAYGASGGYALYHSWTKPLLQVRMDPNLMGVCMYGRVQRYYGGAWHTVATFSCHRTTSEGIVSLVFGGTRVVGSPYRIRAEWRGNTASAARTGAWARFRFRS